VETIDFSKEFRDTDSWRRISPAGKVPAMQDGALTFFESGAMVDYILERYANGRLAPEPGTAESAIHHQWCWFAEATLSRPLGLHRVLRAGKEDVSVLIEDGNRKLHESLRVVEKALTGRAYLLGQEFAAADIMMGYSLGLFERMFEGKYPNAQAYLERLKAREAYKRVLTA
jgi:glutathione S-transferase